MIWQIGTLLLGIIAPIVFVWAITEVKKIAKHSLAQQALTVASGEIKRVYEEVYGELKKIVADGKVTAEEKKRLLEKLKESFANSQDIVIKTMVPKVSEYMLEKMLSDISSK